MPPPAEPRFIGRYELLERLAVGGMAEVWLAVDRGPHALDRLTVVKQILPHLAARPDFVEMFLREARVAARIHHPNVVQIHELGDDVDPRSGAPRPFIAMQYLEGSSLQDLLEALRATDTGRLPLSAVIHLVDQAAAGLHAAHELRDPSGQPLGLVHRDVSPHNLMVDDGAHVTLLDFGIAKDTHTSRDDATRAGLLKGKLAYMSPEQCRQQALDRRSDVFSLGVVTFELLTERRPFRGETDLDLLNAIVKGQRPTVLELRPDCARGVAEVVERALSPDREARWPTAEAFRVALWEAGRAAGVDLDRDAVARVLRDQLQDATGRRRKLVGDALDRTQVSRSGTGTPAARRTSTGLAIGVGVAAGGLGLVGVAAVAGLGALALAVAGVGAWWWVSAPVGAPKDAVRIAVAPVLDPAVLEAENAPVAAFLAPRVGRPVVFEVAADYASAAGAVISGEAAFAMLPEATTRVARAQEPRLRLLAVKEIEGRSSVDAVLVAAPDAGVDPADPPTFRGKSVCFTDPRSSSGHRYPSEWFGARGLDPDTDLALHVSGSHEQVARDLRDGVCVVGATHQGNLATALRDGVLDARFAVVAVTGVTRHDALVAGPATDPILADRVRDLLLKYDPAVHGGSDPHGITGFAPVPAEYAAP